MFRIKAGYLLAARAEDSLALPTGPDDPLTSQLAQMVYRDLCDDGLPEHAMQATGNVVIDAWGCGRDVTDQGLTIVNDIAAKVG